MSAQRVEEILDQLTAGPRRRTASRRAIVEALVEAGDHVTADDLAERVQRRFPSINLSTVYRTLEALEEVGVVDHVHLGHGRAVYHMASDDHQHLVCERCERVVELPFDHLAPFLERMDREFGFAVDRRHFAIVGLCAECRAVGEEGRAGGRPRPGG